MVKGFRGAFMQILELSDVKIPLFFYLKAPKNCQNVLLKPFLTVKIPQKPKFLKNADLKFSNYLLITIDAGFEIDTLGDDIVDQFANFELG